ncbi:hypothetical protein IKP85_01485 [bacterium]|nr:hypothetical protein [bacterium]
MRRFLSVILTAAFCAMPAYASNWVASERVSHVGTIIAKKNSLPGTIHFETVSGTPNNKYAIAANTVQINISDLEYTSNDNEVAYLISHELGEIIVKNIIPNSKFTDSKDIDAMGMDLMINSGYNPLAGIAVLTKKPKNPIENATNTPAHNEEAEYLYNYLYFNYPSKILAGYNNSDEYKTFLAHIEPEINEIKFNKKKNRKFNRTQEKFNTNRNKKLDKYDQTTSKLRFWGVTPELLKSITEPEEKSYKSR